MIPETTENSTSVVDAAASPAVSISLLTASARSLLNPDGIPPELKALPQWVCWRYKATPKGTISKPPYRCNGYPAKTDDPSTWASFAEALAAFNRNPSFAGIGLCLSADDGLVFIDIDDYGDTPDPLAALALTWFGGTYAETSPSGGCARHVFCLGDLPGKAGTKVGMFEAYTHPSNRYLTVTGQRVDGYPATVTNQQAGLDLFYRYGLCKEPLPPIPTDTGGGDDDGYGRPPPDDDCLSMDCPQCGCPAEYPDCEACGYDFTQPDPAGQPPIPTDTEERVQPIPPSVSVGDDERLRLALTNCEIVALYGGDTLNFVNAHGEPDRSTAEQALCLRLMTFAHGDLGTVSRWMDASGCEKWNGDGKRESYQRPTLEKAHARWDGVCFVDPRQEQIEHGREVAAALLRNRPDREPGADDEPGQGGHCGTKPLFIPVSEFVGTPSSPDWTVRRWLPAASLVVVFGDSTAGKSFLAIDWSCCIASGLPWQGHKVKQGAVVYIAGEGHHGLKRRFAAWQHVYGYIESNLYVSYKAVSFTPNGATDIFKGIGELPEVPVLIVVDTLATTIAGDENNGEAMNVFIGYLKALLEGTGATLLVVHHTGHGDKSRARGHSSLKAAMDAEYRVERTDGAGTLTNTKPKDFDPPKPLSFELEVVELPDGWRDPDEPDEPVTSCIFKVTGQAGHAGTKPKKLPASQTIALKALETALADEGETRNGQLGVYLDEWRDAAYRAGIADTPDAKKKAFQRSRNDLVATGHVICADDIYRFADLGKQNSAAMQNSAKRNKKESTD